MNRSTLIRLGLLSLAAVVLSACGGGGGGSVAVTPVTPQRLEDTFGTQFGIDYRAPANSEPVKPAPGDIIPLNLTVEPTALH